MSYTNYNDSLMQLCNIIGQSCLEYISSNDEDVLVRYDDAVEAAAQLIYASQYIMAEITCYSVTSTYCCLTETQANTGEYLGILNAAAQEYIRNENAKEEEEESEATPAEKSDDIIFLNNCLTL